MPHPINIPDPHDGDQEKRVLNGYPVFTKSNVVVLCGFASIETLKGYNLDSVQGVMLSTIESTNIFDPALYPGDGGTVTSLSYHRGGETIDPALRGWTLAESSVAEHPVATYRLIDENHISISVPKMSIMGYLGIVAINASNYGTTTITVSSDIHPNQLYVRYYE